MYAKLSDHLPRSPRDPGCRDNEEWSSCATCEGKCDKSTKSCTACYSGCACKSGYSRNASEKCIPSENCI
ncbi:trypsin Inhibitor like cysteine rich domain protein [Ancylostoma caninum]|uniref:Trypsin Inhibitor like cysteine rich domain protein n=1 Tax=Ancylostoma caninum TaxID=29170 RepID=A0A368GZ74_ANCCA|nr:trypsin Inhibitor like cysteine rich domain protein [Ancylostoma caninum]